MGGFQLWANLPAAQKMTDPRYWGIESAEIPGRANGRRPHARDLRHGGRSTGPVTRHRIDPEYLDVTLEPGVTWSHPTPAGHTVFAYLFEGDGGLRREAGDPRRRAGNDRAVRRRDSSSVTAGAHGARFLLVSGSPLREPVAWRGPIVMNTREELTTAWRELDDGTFVKHPPAGR